MSHLEVTDLRVAFGRRQKPALRGVSFTLDERERLGIIGQSGSGKSVTALAIMGLLPAHAHVTAASGSTAASCWACPRTAGASCAATAWPWSSRSR